MEQFDERISEFIEKAARDKGTLIAMATRDRSGIHRWLMGSEVDVRK